MSSGPGAEQANKRLVIDANIVIRAVLGKKVASLINEFAADVEFLTPKVALADAGKYLPEILQRRGLSGEDIQLALEVLDDLTQHVTVVAHDEYAHLEAEARQRLRTIDEDDWPFVALSLHFSCPLWSEDRDFFGSGLGVWTTDRVRLYLES